MTSEELAEVLAGPIPVAVMIPVGAIEPHGPHLPLDTDLIISRAACERAIARLSGVRGLTAPEVAYGVTDCASGFAGAVGVGARALSSYLHDVCLLYTSDAAAHVCLVSNHLEPAHE